MKKGDVDVTLYIGSTPVSRAYLGDMQVYGGSTTYDSEVEYLESNGTEYINIGLKPMSSDVITITFKATENQSTCFIGCRQSSAAGKCVIGSGTNSTIIYGALGTSSNIKLASFNLLQHTVVLDIPNGVATIDGGESVSVGNFTDNDLNLFLFACNQAGTVSLFSKIQVMSVQIGERSKLIPVRVGNVGYMYDEVRGILLGNAGTGAFTFGDDVSVSE